MVRNAIDRNLIDNLKDNEGLRIENDSLLRLLEIQETKVDYYLQQIDMQSNWFILFVSGVFVVFGIASYAGFRYEINKITIEQHEQNEKNDSHFRWFDEKINGLQDYINEVKSNSIAINSNVFTTVSNMYADREDYTMAFGMAIGAINHCIMAKQNNTDVDFLKKMDNKIMYTLENALDYIHFIYYNDDISKKHVEFFKSDYAKELMESLIFCFPNIPSDSKNHATQISYMLGRIIDVSSNHENDIEYTTQD